MLHDERVAGQPSVTAIVVTHNSSAAVARCLDAVTRQTSPPTSIVVVDNASVEPLPEDLPPQTTVLRLNENLGPAGGFARGLAMFLDGSDDYAWLMDDDCSPLPRALETQLEVASAESIVLATVTDESQVLHGHGWWGALIPRAVVERVGLPREDFFWWIEDTEYLQWRIPRSGAGVRFTDMPVMEISRSRSDASKPSWKYYYEARNQVYYRFHVQRSTQRPPPRPLTVRIRTWRAVRTVTKLAVRSAVRERDQRARKLWMVVRGTGDGLIGRLGRIVPVDDSHRPVIGEPPTSDPR